MTALRPEIATASVRVTRRLRSIVGLLASMASLLIASPVSSDYITIPRWECPTGGVRVTDHMGSRCELTECEPGEPCRVDEMVHLPPEGAVCQRATLCREDMEIRHGSAARVFGPTSCTTGHAPLMGRASEAGV